MNLSLDVCSCSRSSTARETGLVVSNFSTFLFFLAQSGAFGGGVCSYTLVLKEVVESQLKMQRSTQAMMIVIGGFLQPRTGPKNPRLQGVEKIDPRSNSWSSVADFPMKSSGAVALTLRGHLFCLAYEPVENRRDATLVTETRIFEFDLVKNQWHDARSNFSDQVLTCIDECLQASGAVTVCEETSVIYTMSGTEFTAVTDTVASISSQ
ncbi:hypothetical protein C0Q70_15756 [Pomacea canaliculata]|uniref:Uncharacterized protein n=1 Tax=Pomacea canaliculata TaxID=400727 RepID=A0A2T7NVQ6_POMCA|nr:hypothetical protein C0Q70_15756 [Pomacea canaliculata]